MSSFAAADTAALKDRLHKAAAESSLDTPDMKPWHLLVGFQLFDAKGQPNETGTIEEWWASPKLHKIVYTSPSYTNMELNNEGGSYKTSASLYVPEILQLIKMQIEHPLPLDRDLDEASLSMQKVAFGKLTLDCLSYSPKNTQPIAGKNATYCFEQDKSSLLFTQNYGALAITQPHVGMFQQRRVAVDQSLKLFNVPAATAHIEKLESASLTAADFLPPTNLVRVAGPEPEPLGAVAANAILKTPPRYPDRAKQNHIAGTVAIHAIIGKDGHLHNLKVFSSPDPDLSDAALLAVRQWTYQPYVVNGEVFEVDTMIAVNFSFGPAR